MPQLFTPRSFDVGNVCSSFQRMASQWARLITILRQLQIGTSVPQFFMSLSRLCSFPRARWSASGKGSFAGVNNERIKPEIRKGLSWEPLHNAASGAQPTFAKQKQLPLRTQHGVNAAIIHVISGWYSIARIYGLGLDAKCPKWSKPADQASRFLYATKPFVISSAVSSALGGWTYHKCVWGCKW